MLFRSDEFGLVALGLPPLSTPMMESTRPMDIDLPPKDWVSERKKPREPIFGPGLPDALAYGITWAVVFFGVYYIIHGHF